MRTATTLLKGIALLLTASIFFACKKNKTAPPAATLVKQWQLTLNTAFENPAPAGRTETGTATVELYDDNSLKYQITVNSLAAGDALTAAHIHWGDPVTNGPVIVNFSPVFTNNAASGTLTGLRQTLIDSLQTGATYVNVHSTQLPGGLVRAQMDKTMDFAITVALNGANEVPANTSTATGVALIRLMSDKTLYSKVTVTNLEANDTLTAAHIHTAATGVNGPVLQGLCAADTDFGVNKNFALDDAKVTSVKTAAVYVNVHSKRKPAGIIRGQIR
ncbi:MAG: CHRD domain-containing protein [Chitinophagaceae bacterium]|nr:CHRD domain-containing protein [Chitinophagaceae bacterium]